VAEPRAPNLQRNRILAALSNADYTLLQPQLEPVPLKFRERLQSANKQIRTVYFPESGIASVVAASVGGPCQTEIALVGRGLVSSKYPRSSRGLWHVVRHWLHETGRDRFVPPRISARSDLKGAVCCAMPCCSVRVIKRSHVTIA
jgi:hypothetical protein